MALNKHSSYRVVHVDAERSGLGSLSAELPYIEKFLEAAAALSNLDAKRDIRAYLKDLLRVGYFAILSPRTGRLVSSGTSIVLNDKSVFFGFPDEPDLLVGVDNLGMGFPISAAVVQSLGIVISTGNVVWGINDKSLFRLNEIINNIGWNATKSVEPVTLVSGDPNFAHHAWNQLPCLEAAIESDQRFSILSTHEPLGPLSELFPELGRIRIDRCPGSWLEKANRLGRTFAPLGSTLLSQKIVSRLGAYAFRNLTTKARKIAENLQSTSGKVFWMSVRTHNRTLSNQSEVLEAVGAEFLRTFPNSTLILDGHSQQCDLLLNKGSYDVGRTEALILEGERVAHEVAAALGQHGRAIKAVGLPIIDTIYLSRLADFYFCHHGTVQHKIGWFSSIPGVVHSNLRTLALKPAKWVADQSEIASEPFYLPESFVSDQTDITGQNMREVSLRLENYSIKDVQNAAEFVVSTGKQRLTSGLDG